MFSAFSTCVSWFDPTIVSRLIDDAQVGRSRDYLVIIYFFSDNLDFEFLKNMSPVPIPVTDFWSVSLKLMSELFLLSLLGQSQEHHCYVRYEFT
jgi:hypothetical protein